MPSTLAHDSFRECLDGQTGRWILGASSCTPPSCTCTKRWTLQTNHLHSQTTKIITSSSSPQCEDDPPLHQRLLWRFGATSDPFERERTDRVECRPVRSLDLLSNRDKQQHPRRGFTVIHRENRNILRSSSPGRLRGGLTILDDRWRSNLTMWCARHWQGNDRRSTTVVTYICVPRLAWHLPQKTSHSYKQLQILR